MEEGRSAFNILTGKPTGRKALGMSKRRWEDNIITYFRVFPKAMELVNHKEEYYTSFLIKFSKYEDCRKRCSRMY